MEMLGLLPYNMAYEYRMHANAHPHQLACLNARSFRLPQSMYSWTRKRAFKLVPKVAMMSSSGSHPSLCPMYRAMCLQGRGRGEACPACNSHLTLVASVTAGPGNGNSSLSRLQT